MSDRLAEAQEYVRFELAEVLERHVRPLFRSNPRLTILVRFEGLPGRDVLVTDDSMKGIQEIIARSMARDEIRAPAAMAEGKAGE